MIKNPVFHNQTNHIDIWHHISWELVDKTEIRQQSTKIGEQLADIITQEISSEKFIH